MLCQKPRQTLTQYYIWGMAHRATEPGRLCEASLRPTHSASTSPAVAIKITAAKAPALLSIITAPLGYAELAAALEDGITQRLAQFIRQLECRPPRTGWVSVAWQVDAERVFPGCVPCPDHLHPMKGERYAIDRQFGARQGDHPPLSYNADIADGHFNQRGISHVL
jgi:hypothetical protein